MSITLEASNISFHRPRLHRVCCKDTPPAPRRCFANGFALKTISAGSRHIYEVRNSSAFELGTPVAGRRTAVSRMKARTHRCTAVVRSLPNSSASCFSCCAHNTKKKSPSVDENGITKTPSSDLFFFPSCKAASKKPLRTSTTIREETTLRGVPPFNCGSEAHIPQPKATTTT